MTTPTIREVLLGAYSDVSRATFALQRCGVGREHLNPNQAPAQFWTGAFDLVDKLGLLPRLVELALADKSIAAFHGQLRAAYAAHEEAHRAGAADPRGAKGEPGDDMAVARRMPIAALVAVLVERGAPGDVSAEELTEFLRREREATPEPWEARLNDGGANWAIAKVGFGRIGVAQGAERDDAEFIAAARALSPRLAREVVILRALAAHKMPCGHDLADIVYGGPDLNGLPAIAQCGQCLANRQAAKAALPRTPHTVLAAMSRAYNTARFAAHVAALRAPLGSTEEVAAGERLNRLETWRLAVEDEAANEAALGEDYGTDWTDDVLAADYQARLDGTTPPDAGPPEAP
jgi:hypothetical protein